MILGDIRQYLSYDPGTGNFYWIRTRTNRIRVGGEAGCRRPDGYCNISWMGKRYYAHRLAWWYKHGEMPSVEIDHINGDPSDNRIVNLRLATHAQNHKNRRAETNATSRYKGVSFHARTKRWKVEVIGDGQRTHVGYFDGEVQAAMAYDGVAFEKHGHFARLNFPV